MLEEWEKRYGPERAAKLRKTMFAGYEQVSLIDTKAYDVDECLEESRAVAGALDLGHGVVQGSVQLLERMFSGGAGRRDSGGAARRADRAHPSVCRE